MKMNRCVKDSFGYCTCQDLIIEGKPGKQAYDYVGRLVSTQIDESVCHQNYKTCKHYQTFTQSAKNLIPQA